jgi:hypothetical protein
MADEADGPVGLLPVGRHQRIQIVGIRRGQSAALFDAVHGSIHHDGQVAGEGGQRLTYRGRDQGDVAHHTGMAGIVAGAEPKPELAIPEGISAKFQQLQIPNQGYPPLRVDQVLRFDAGLVEHDTGIGAAVTQVVVEAVSHARKMDRRRRGGAALGHWRDLARLWRTISRPGVPWSVTLRHRFDGEPA